MKPPAMLDAALTHLIDEAGFEAGAAVLHVDSGESIGVNADRPFPACSVFKVPVLVEAFRQAAAGEFSLLNRWPLADDDKAVGSGVLQALDANLAPTVHDLLSLMIIISDNTAADILTRRLGPEQITRTMQALGLTRTWVTITCRELLAHAFGDADPRLLPYERSRRVAQSPPHKDSAAYHAGPDNDVTTPGDMVRLFACIQTGEGMDALGIGPSERARMLAILHRQQLNDRLPRYLPAVQPFAHKTGSMSGAYEIHNDAGIVALPDGGHVAMAVFTRAQSPDPGDPRALSSLRRRMDDLIAEVALAAYEHYTTRG